MKVNWERDDVEGNEEDISQGEWEMVDFRICLEQVTVSFNFQQIEFLICF